MKILNSIGILFLSVSVLFAKSDRHTSGIYCQATDGNYAVHRKSDDQSLANAWFVESTEEGQTFSAKQTCEMSAKSANFVQQNIYCGRSIKGPKSGWSVYRISDDKNLSAITFERFSLCLMAVVAANDDIGCLPYGDGEYSQYNLITGKDIGDNVYGTMDNCVKSYNDEWDL